jgi:hypothetical protein
MGMSAILLRPLPAFFRASPLRLSRGNVSDFSLRPLPVFFRAQSAEALTWECHRFRCGRCWNFLTCECSALPGLALPGLMRLDFLKNAGQPNPPMPTWLRLGSAQAQGPGKCF